MLRTCCSECTNKQKEIEGDECECDRTSNYKITGNEVTATMNEDRITFATKKIVEIFLVEGKTEQSEKVLFSCVLP